MRRTEKVQNANHCRKDTRFCGKCFVTLDGSGRVTIITGRKIPLSKIKSVRHVLSEDGHWSMLPESCEKHHHDDSKQFDAPMIRFDKNFE